MMHQLGVLKTKPPKTLKLELKDPPLPPSEGRLLTSLIIVQEWLPLIGGGGVGMVFGFKTPALAL